MSEHDENTELERKEFHHEEAQALVARAYKILRDEVGLTPKDIGVNMGVMYYEYGQGDEPDYTSMPDMLAFQSGVKLAVDDVRAIWQVTE